MPPHEHQTLSTGSKKMKHKNDIKMLARVCQKVGDYAPYWTQGPGSNISVKSDATHLWIKRSGACLSDVTESSGAVCIDYQALRAATLELKGTEGEKKYSQLLNETKFGDDYQGRASMESGFHSILPKKYVVHMHSLASILMAYLVSSKAEEFSNWAKSFDLKWSKVDFCLPGLELSQMINKHTESDVILLENHGIIIQTDSDPCEELKEWEHIEKNFVDTFGFGELAAYYADLSVKPDLSKWKAPVPFRKYLPDIAVFEKELGKYLLCSSPNEQNFLIKSEYETTDDRLLEIWLATVILYQTCPDLPEMQSDMSKKITELPTELERKAHGES